MSQIREPEILTPPPDLTDPAVLAGECEVLAQGMDVQSQSYNMGSAMGAVPNPQAFFARCAQAFRLAAAKLKAAPAAGSAAPPEPEPAPPPKPRRQP